MQRIKQVILIRRDLKMRRGKEIAQGSHASQEFLMVQLRGQLEQDAEAKIDLNPCEKQWIAGGMAKICLQVKSEQELLDYHKNAQEKGIRSYLIRDSGRTEFGGVATLTACAIGPDEETNINAVTGSLPLY